MSAPIDLILSRLASFKLRENSPGRWRSICPCCGEKNGNTLSIGVGETGAVLIKCFKLGCEPGQIAQALGLELSDLFPPRESHGAPLAKRRLISDRQALKLLHDEAQLVAMCGANIAHGVELSDDNKDRLLTAAGRVAYLRDEVMS